MTTALEMVMSANARIGHVTPQEAKAEIEAGSATVLDIREPTEWEDHIKGAVQVPRGVLEAAADPASPRHLPTLDPSRRVIVYCRTGARAALAGATLVDLGYLDVVNLDGGIAAWQAEGLPLAAHHEGM